MKRKVSSFIAGLATGAILLGGGTALANSNVSGELREATVYVDGAPVTMEAVNVADTNYVKLRDVGEAVGFNVYWNGAIQVDSTSPYTGEAPTVSDATAEIRERMIRLVNELRRENGLPELPRNDSLMAAAQDCADHHFTSHNRYEAQSLAAHGWPYGGGTNLTWFTYGSDTDVAASAVRNWRWSKPHYETMLRNDVTCLGVGVSFEDNVVYCYLMLGDPEGHNAYA